MNLRHTQTVTTHRSLCGRAFRLAVAVALLSAVATAQTAFSQSSNDAMSLLLDQNRQLQAEIQALRGQLDEQGFEIKKLQRDSLNRYTDVDQRLSDLEIAAPQTVPPATAQRTQGRAPSQSSQSSQSSLSASNRPSLQPAVLSEQQLYQMAYDSVINSHFERSIAEFDQYLGQYPEGRFVTNAHYWKGQAYLYLERFEEARSAYEIILEQYSDSSKLPDAMYGLGLAYQGMGNIQRARQMLTDIKRRFPNTGVANLADTRLLSL